ncbi:MAG: hypothetical protein KA436_07275 [Oligoflexales bacterium]|nr:hypothetical protein [Oligoflexales bacterium]
MTVLNFFLSTGVMNKVSPSGLHRSHTRGVLSPQSALVLEAEVVQPGLGLPEGAPRSFVSENGLDTFHSDLIQEDLQEWDNSYAGLVNLSEHLLP